MSAISMLCNMIASFVVNLCCKRDGGSVIALKKSPCSTKVTGITNSPLLKSSTALAKLWENKILGVEW